MTGKPTLNRLLARQLSKAVASDGALSVDLLLQLVSDAYDEKDLDRRRSDRANRLMGEELEAAIQASQLQNIRFKAALDNMSQGLCLYDQTGRLTVCNQKFREIYGIDESVNLERLTLQEIYERSSVFENVDEVNRQLLLAEHSFLERVPGATADQVLPNGCILSISRTNVADGGYLDTIADVTDARRAAAQIAHLARHDALTNLANRVGLRERLAELRRLDADGKTHAILCIDLDRFKPINDTLGHAVGDELLVLVAQRLLSCVDASCTVARLGGDEFAVVVPNTRYRRLPAVIARRIVKQISMPFLIQEHRVQIGASVGIHAEPASVFEPHDVLRKADLALYRAKALGRGQFCAFSPEMDDNLAERQTLEKDLRRAVRENEFQLHYQPQIDVRSAQLTGFEALVRWMHPRKGLLLPSEFISACEETGLINEVGEFVLRQACADAVSWPGNISVSVNLSPAQFTSGKIAKQVRDALEASNLDPSRLDLEITESMMLKNTEEVLMQLGELKDLGCGISLDDFGMGYSSLSYIRNFGFDRIKIDRSFISDVGKNSDSVAIVRAVCGLCASLGIKSTAEGIETIDQFNMVNGEGCDNVQGYLFSTPVPYNQTFSIVSNCPEPKSLAG